MSALSDEIFRCLNPAPTRPVIGSQDDREAYFDSRESWIDIIEDASLTCGEVVEVILPLLYAGELKAAHRACLDLLEAGYQGACIQRARDLEWRDGHFEED